MMGSILRLLWHHRNSDTTTEQTYVPAGEPVAIPPDVDPSHVTIHVEDDPRESVTTTTTAEPPAEPVEPSEPAPTAFAPPPSPEAALTPLGGAEPPPAPESDITMGPAPEVASSEAAGLTP